MQKAFASHLAKPARPESYDHVEEVTAQRWRERNIKALRKSGYTDEQITEMMAAA